MLIAMLVSLPAHTSAEPRYNCDIAGTVSYQAVKITLGKVLSVQDKPTIAVGEIVTANLTL